MSLLNIFQQRFFVGKFLNGFCLGVLTSVGTAYVSEVAPLALRGLSIACLSLSLCIGPFVCVLINNTTQSYTTRMAYRGIFIPQWIFGAIALLFMPFLPESPYFLSGKNKDEKAMKSLKKLYTGDLEVQQQYAIMKVTVEEESIISQQAGSYLDCFKLKNLKRTILACGPFLMQPLSGVAYVGGYSTYYFELSGATTSEAYKISIGAQVLSMTGVVASWFLIDRIGRRPLLIMGMINLSILNLIVACTGLKTDNVTAMKVSTAFLCMYNFFYNLALGPLAYIYAAELSTVFLRVKTIAFGSIANSGLQTMWSFVLPYMFNPDQANMGSKINFIFTACLFISVFVFWVWLPESANRSFEEIDEMFNNNIPARKWKTYVSKVSAESEDSYIMEKGITEHVEDVKVV